MDGLEKNLKKKLVLKNVLLDWSSINVVFLCGDITVT